MTGAEVNDATADARCSPVKAAPGLHRAGASIRTCANSRRFTSEAGSLKAECRSRVEF